MSNKKNVNKNIEFDVVKYLETKSADPFKSLAVALKDAAGFAAFSRMLTYYKKWSEGESGYVFVESKTEK